MSVYTLLKKFGKKYYFGETVVCLMYPKISCIIPVHNELYLKNSLNSLSRQNFNEFEILLIDDYSNDNSLRILKQYANMDSRFKVYEMQQSVGAVVCRNYGLSRARGEFIIFLDADDFFYEEMFSHSFELIKENRADVVIFCSETNMSLAYSLAYGLKFLKKFAGTG